MFAIQIATLIFFLPVHFKPAELKQIADASVDLSSFFDQIVPDVNS